MLRKKVKRGGFHSADKFSADLEAIFSNCRDYNEVRACVRAFVLVRRYQIKRTMHDW